MLQGIFLFDQWELKIKFVAPEMICLLPHCTCFYGGHLALVGPASSLLCVLKKSLTHLAVSNLWLSWHDSDYEEETKSHCLNCYCKYHQVLGTS